MKNTRGHLPVSVIVTRQEQRSLTLCARIESFAKRNEMDLAEESFNKYVQQYRPGRDEIREFETLLCDLYSRQIFALSAGKTREHKQARLDLFYKARRICMLSEADKKEIIKLEKALK